ncbi:heme biosynthesis HemY N-terminal domain-containing protein, partial [Lysobacter sp. D1-1-M9]
MNIFRSLLFWIVLALVGALVAQLLAQDPGLVIVSYGDATYEKSLAYTLMLVIVAVLALWLLWKLLSAPFVMLRRRRKKHARARLIEGLDALHLGHWSRAEKSLAQALDNQEVGAVARVSAAHAAAARGDSARAQQHLDALAVTHPSARAVALADWAMAQDRPADAL